MSDVFLKIYDYDFSELANNFNDILTQFKVDWLQNLPDLTLDKFKATFTEQIDKIINSKQFTVKEIDIPHITSITIENTSGFNDNIRITVVSNEDLTQHIHPGAHAYLKFFDIELVGIVYAISFLKTSTNKLMKSFDIIIDLPYALLQSLNLQLFHYFKVLPNDLYYTAFFGEYNSGVILLYTKLTNFLSNYFLFITSFFPFVIANRKLMDYIALNTDTEKKPLVEVRDLYDEFFNEFQAIPKLENKYVYLLTTQFDITGSALSVLDNLVRDIDIALDFQIVKQNDKFKFSVLLARNLFAPPEFFNSKERIYVFNPISINLSKNTSNKLYFAVAQPPFADVLKEYSDFQYIVNDLLQKYAAVQSLLSFRQSFGFDYYTPTVYNTDLKCVNNNDGTVKIDLGGLRKELIYYSLRKSYYNIATAFSFTGRITCNGIENLKDVFNKIYKPLQFEDYIGLVKRITYRLNQGFSRVEATTEYDVSFVYQFDTPITKFMRELYERWFTQPY